MLKILGDPHLGREFRNSVPLHRRGERERLVREQFLRELDPQGSELHVCMGDLFDSPSVDHDTVHFAAKAYLEAAQEDPNTTFVVLRGNHDDSRDLDRVTGFDLFKLIVSHQYNIIVVEDFAACGEHLFFGWCPDRSAEELVAEARGVFEDGYTTVWGHWDVDLRSSPHNLIPTRALADWGITKAYTGHVHLPDAFTRDGVDVTVTGSMQPYAHGEDATGEWYVTVTKDQIDPEALKNKCVRVLLRPGETFYDVQLDCLQLKYDRTEDVSEALDIEVTMDGFDLSKTYEEVFSQYDLAPDVKEKIDSKWQTTFTQQG